MALTKTPVCDFGKKAEDFKLKSIHNILVSFNVTKVANKMVAQTLRGQDEQIPSMGYNIKWFN